MQNTSHTNAPLIKLEQVGFHAEGKDILSNISQIIQAGEMVSIIGPNGGGKSTLLKLMAGNLTPSSGRIVRQDGLTIGLVPQRFYLPKSMPLRVGDYLALSAKTKQALPKNFDEKLGIAALKTKSMHQLSGGELQRVLLAASLTPIPELLLLDEPMQGVDPQSEQLLYELISNIPNQLGCAVVIVSHDLHWVMKGTGHVMCVNGHICCEGSPQTVINHESFKSMFALQPEFYAHNHHCEHEHRHNAGLSYPALNTHQTNQVFAQAEIPS